MQSRQFGNIEINVNDLNIDLLSISGHKLYAPKGIGALFARVGVEFSKIQDGGHQERDKRAGTENVAGIVGLGKAIEIAHNNLGEYNKKLTNLREYFIEQIQKKVPNAKINGHRTKRLPGNCSVSFPGIDGEELLMKLDKSGVCASAGSACSSGENTPSHVLTAIGLTSNMANGALRFTFGDENTKEEVDYLISAMREIMGTSL